MPVYFDAFTRFGRRYGQHRAHPWSLEHLITELQHCSISGALVADTRCVYGDAWRQNLELSQLLKEHEGLFPLWNVMPHWTGEFPEPEELTGRMRQHDVRAVTIHPKQNGWQVLSRTSEPLLRALEKERILTIVEWPGELPEAQLEEVLEKYPQLPLLVRGTRWVWQRVIVPLLQRYRNLHIGFDDFQISYGPEWLTELGCEDQLVFCSNAPTMAAGAHRTYIDYADVAERVREKIASGNLVRLLKGQRPAREVVNENEDELMRSVRQGRPLDCLVIDSHCHVLREGENGAGGSYVMHDGGPSGILRLARRMGVKALGFMSWSGTVGIHADDGNAATRACLDAMPGGCWGLASCDALIETGEQTRAKLEGIFRDKRFLGLKPYPLFNVHYDQPEHAEWWRFGDERRLYALIHVCREDYSELDGLCPKYPNMTFLVAHSGSSYAVADKVIEKARKYPNLMLEITLTPVPCGMIDYLVAGVGAERVFYGSDLPMRDPRPQLGWVVFSRLPIDQKRKILGQNARQMIGAIRGFNGIADPLEPMTR